MHIVGGNSSEIPRWFRSSGGLVAAFCACILGMIPFCSIACLNLISLDDAPEQALNAPIVVPTVAASLPPVSASDSNLIGTLTAFQQDLQEQLRFHETARQASERTMASRMRTLEENLAHGMVRHMDTPRTSTQMISEASSLADSLGVDWAAWTAGAEIDHTHTSSGLGRSIPGRLMRVLTAKVATQWRGLIGNVSQPPEVVLAADSSPPSRCFSFSGNGTLAIRFSQDVQLTHIVLEQLPSWATTHPQSAPRFFEVRGTPMGNPSTEYSTSLGAFEFSLQGQRAQAFALELQTGKLWRAVQLVFLGNWGDDHTEVCRIRAMGAFADYA